MVEHRAIQQQRRNRRDEGNNVEHAEKPRHLPCRVHLVSSSSELHWVSFVVRSTSGGKTTPLGHFLASDSRDLFGATHPNVHSGSLLGFVGVLWPHCAVSMGGERITRSSISRLLSAGGISGAPWSTSVTPADPRHVMATLEAQSLRRDGGGAAERFKPKRYVRARGAARPHPEADGVRRECPEFAAPPRMTGLSAPRLGEARALLGTARPRRRLTAAAVRGWAGTLRCRGTPATAGAAGGAGRTCLLYTSTSPR